MKKKRIRVEFDKIKIYENRQESGGDSGGDSGETTVMDFPDIGPEFILESENANRPTGEVAFAVPADDMPRVRAWFSGEWHDVTMPESVTLHKNMRTAVHDTLDRFFTTAKSGNLFTSPFRIGWCYRLFDGSVTPLRGIRTLQTISEAPLLEIRSHSLTDKALTTGVDIHCHPSRLYLRVASPEKLDGFRDIITAVEIYATAQTALYDPAGDVAGVRSVADEGERVRCWYYDHYGLEEIALKTESESRFRLLCSISPSAISPTSAPLPLEAGTLSGFEKRNLYRQTSDATGGESGSGNKNNGTPGMGWKPFLNFTTQPLCLGMPETEKRISQVLLRGVFQRNEVKMRLYGSHHRENRHLLASATGPYITGVNAGRHRWFSVSIECPMRKDDFIEALTFIVSYPS